MPHRQAKPPNAFADAATAIAKRFGVSAKALRVYERMGLIRPARTQSGWRSYGQADVERLYARWTELEGKRTQAMQPSSSGSAVCFSVVTDRT